MFRIYVTIDKISLFFCDISRIYLFLPIRCHVRTNMEILWRPITSMYIVGYIHAYPRASNDLIFQIN